METQNWIKFLKKYKDWIKCVRCFKYENICLSWKIEKERRTNNFFVRYTFCKLHSKDVGHAFSFYWKTEINNFDVSQNTIYSYSELITLSKSAGRNKNPRKATTIVQCLFKKWSNHPGDLPWRLFRGECSNTFVSRCYVNLTLCFVEIK